jgi:hypothetical protein
LFLQRSGLKEVYESELTDHQAHDGKKEAATSGFYSNDTSQSMEPK